MFYIFIYKPEEERKRNARESATVVLDKKHAGLGKHRSA